MAETCRKPNCSWLALPTLNELKEPPPLLPNPELSGVGVILGFSITAYLTVVLLLFHYIFVYNPHRIGVHGQEYVNPVDRGLLAFFRGKMISWTPTRRFEYAIEKSVLILSDTQLVTGLAILIAGYSQLDCGISSYHWQIMVYVAWFSSFTFLSAMAFLEGYFRTNNNLRLIRVFFMCIMWVLMSAALLPTGSRNWLDAAQEDGPLYAGLSAQCFFEQLPMSTFTRGGPRIYSMVFSLLTVAFSYIHSGIRLFDPTAEFTRKYFRAIPGASLKQLLCRLEQKATRRGLRAAIWTFPYLVLFAGFTTLRATYDVAESMLAEIIWLSFAIAWGSLKVWDTRDLAWITRLPDGTYVPNNTVNEEDAWSFGQTLPLVLLLLPVLAMFQSYLDNDAKAQDAMLSAHSNGSSKSAQELQNAQLKVVIDPSPDGEPRGERISSICNTTSRCITRCNHHQPSRAGSSTLVDCSPTLQPTMIPPRDPRPPFSLSPTRESIFPRLPRHPYPSFFVHRWYRDHIYLIVCQILLLGCIILWFESELFSILGISYLLRNRLFLIWVFGFIPVSCVVHLAVLYVTASLVQKIDGAEDWLNGRGRWRVEKAGDRRFWRTMTAGQWTYWLLRVCLKAGCLTMGFLVSAQIAGPQVLDFGDG